MANKTINTRIQLKNDSQTNWNAATNFKPMLGEPILVNDADCPLRFGDGSTVAKNLPPLFQKITNSEVDGLF